MQLPGFIYRHASWDFMTVDYLTRAHGIFERMMRYVVDQCTAAGLVNPDVHVGGGRYTIAAKCVDSQSEGSTVGASGTLGDVHVELHLNVVIH